MNEEGSHVKTELLRLKVLDLESVTCTRNTGKAAWLEPGVPGEDEGDEIRGAGRPRPRSVWTKAYGTSLEDLDKQTKVI